MNKKFFFMIIVFCFAVSYAQQYQNNYCDLDCMEQAFNLTDPIVAVGEHEQAYEHFEALYQYCTAVYCDENGDYK